MFKKRLLFILMVLLIFMIIPYSFALDYNLTENIGGNDENILSEVSLDEIHVDVNGNDDNKGDYQNPLSTIQKAINISKDNSKIIVHEGTYKENNLNITKSLEIHGQGNVVIDAENKNRIITIHTDSSSEILLSGLTFINGNSKQMAGAIYVLGAVTTIDNCKFINNTAATEGGAIFWNSAFGRLTNTLIEDNYARDGSGVKWGESDTSLIIGSADYGQIINCTFKNNHLMQDEDACIGLAVYGNNIKIIDSTFTDHKTSYNSSFEVLYINGDSGTVRGCLFANNSMTITGALGLDGNYAVAIGNKFINNTVSFPEAFGGAIGVQSETANIYNNTFISNGGDECTGGAVYINIMEDHQFSFINITKNIFKNNKGLIGGAIFANGQGCMLDLKINENTFESDNAVYGAGIYVTDIWAPVIITDNNFTNLISDNAAGIYAVRCILDISNNIMNNCTSLKTENIFSNGEIKGKLKLKFNDKIGVLNQPTTLTASLSDDKGNFITTSNINFKINGESISGKKGLNNFTATFDTFANYTISGSYEYSATVEDGKLTILHGANLTVLSIVNYGKKTIIKLNLTDENGKAINNSDIFLNVNDNNLVLTTNEEGIAQTTQNFNYGTHVLIARFVDDNYFKSVNATVSIQVLSSIISNDLTRAYNSGSDFKVTLLNSDGSPLTDTNVDFNVNGVKYTVKTDSNGIANLNEKLSEGFYIISVANPITGDEASNTLNIVKRITDNQNINTYFTANSFYRVRIWNDDGNPVSAGETVTFTVNGKNYQVKTDNNGFASFKISLNPNSYAITATYKNVKVSNKIVVKPLLTAKNISKKKAKKIKFQAKLVNTQGKAVKGKKITFKIKGKTYKVKTNNKGIAKLTLKNLKVGKYKIVSKYGKSTIKNTIKIRK